MGGPLAHSSAFCHAFPEENVAHFKVKTFIWCTSTEYSGISKPVLYVYLFGCVTDIYLQKVLECFFVLFFYHKQVEIVVSDITDEIQMEMVIVSRVKSSIIAWAEVFHIEILQSTVKVKTWVRVGDRSLEFTRRNCQQNFVSKVTTEH